MAHIQLIGLSTDHDPNGSINAFPYAFPVIISRLRKTRHTFDHLDLHFDKLTKEEMINRLSECKSEIYGISAWSFNYLYLKQVVAKIRETCHDATIIVGGIISVSDEVILDTIDIDIVVTGAEGELILPDLLDQLDLPNPDLSSVTGISYKNNQGVYVKTPKRVLMSKDEFQDLEMPAYDYFDAQIQEFVDNINRREDVPVKGFPFLTSRGCPFPCSFCGHLYDRKVIRKKWDKWFDEAEYLVNRYGVQGFYIYDNNMFLNERDVEEYCALYRERQATFKLAIQIRSTFGTERMFQNLFDHGVRVAIYGFETGSPVMLDRMRKGTTLPEMKHFIEAASKSGISIYGNFLFGTPGENRSTVLETASFMLYLKRLSRWQKKQFPNLLLTSGYSWSSLLPYEGAELFEVARKAGIITDEIKFLTEVSGDRWIKPIKKRKRVSIYQWEGEINMSEFTSTRAMQYFIRSLLAGVDAVDSFETGHVLQAVRNMAQAAQQFVGFIATRVLDFVNGRRGRPFGELEPYYRTPIRTRAHSLAEPVPAPSTK